MIFIVPILVSENHVLYSTMLCVFPPQKIGKYLKATQKSNRLSDTPITSQNDYCDTPPEKARISLPPFPPFPSPSFLFAFSLPPQGDICMMLMSSYKPPFFSFFLPSSLMCFILNNDISPTVPIYYIYRPVVWKQVCFLLFFPFFFS